MHCRSSVTRLGCHESVIVPEPSVKMRLFVKESSSSAFPHARTASSAHRDVLAKHAKRVVAQSVGVAKRRSRGSACARAHDREG